MSSHEVAGSSARAAGALNHWAFSPVGYSFLNCLSLQFVLYSRILNQFIVLLKK